MPSCGKAAASTALPQPPKTSQKVPKNSAASFRDINPSFTINLKLLLGSPRRFPCWADRGPANPHCRFSKSRVAYDIGGSEDGAKPSFNACLRYKDRPRIAVIELSLRLRAQSADRGIA